MISYGVAYASRIPRCPFTFLFCISIKESMACFPKNNSFREGVNMDKRGHNNIWCETFFDKVFPDLKGYCHLCGALLHELTVDEAIALVDRFEGIAVDRTKAENWNAADWLFDDEVDVLTIAKNRVLSSRLS
jgi:hypothetical protein